MSFEHCCPQQPSCTNYPADSIMLSTQVETTPMRRNRLGMRAGGGREGLAAWQSARTCSELCSAYGT